MPFGQWAVIKALWLNWKPTFYGRWFMGVLFRQQVEHLEQLAWKEGSQA